MKGLKFFPILFCLKIIGLPWIKRLHKEIPIKSGDKTKVSITAVNLEINSIIRILGPGQLYDACSLQLIENHAYL